MTREEYENKKALLKKRYDKELKLIQQEFAFSNNPYKIGDIIKSNSDQIIKIDNIKWYSNGLLNDFPTCLYSGELYTKAMKPFKKSKRDRISQWNVKEAL